jgi:uncharacterized protein
MNDDNHAGVLIPIMALAYEHHPDPEMRPYKEPMSIERREQLIVGVAASVPAIYRYFAAERKLEVGKLSSVKIFRRDAPKVGRNEPCPCGSGKKFKHCCAKRLKGISPTNRRWAERAAIQFPPTRCQLSELL